MQLEELATIQAWALTALVYPGLLFGAALALLGEWLAGAVRPLFTPRIYRTQAAPRSLLQPLYDFLKLAGRQYPSYPALTSATSGPVAGAATPPLNSILAAVCAIGPVLALALMPLPGSPISLTGGPAGDLLAVVLLLGAYPVAAGIIGANSDVLGLSGARDLGRLLTGLFPALFAVAALVEVTGGRSLMLAGLSAAPETAAQTIVRLLAGAALLVALPWWVDRRDGTTAENWATYAGRLLQRAALAAFWAVLVLPMPGELPWALLVTVGGALAAYATLRTIEERWATGKRETAAANLAWATAMPVAVAAMIISFVER